MKIKWYLHKIILVDTLKEVVLSALLLAGVVFIILLLDRLVTSLFPFITNWGFASLLLVAAVWAVWLLAVALWRIWQEKRKPGRE